MLLSVVSYAGMPHTNPEKEWLPSLIQHRKALLKCCHGKILSLYAHAITIAAITSSISRNFASLATASLKKMWEKTMESKKGKKVILLYFLLGRNCRRQCRNRAPAPRINLHPCLPMHLLHLPSSYHSKWNETMWQLTGSLGIASVSVKHAMYDHEQSDRGPPCLLVTVPKASVSWHPTDLFFSCHGLIFREHMLAQWILEYLWEVFLPFPIGVKAGNFGMQIAGVLALQSFYSFICPAIQQMEKKTRYGGLYAGI